MYLLAVVCKIDSQVHEVILAEAGLINNSFEKRLVESAMESQIRFIQEYLFTKSTLFGMLRSMI